MAESTEGNGVNTGRPRPDEVAAREDYLARANAQIRRCVTCDLREDRWDTRDPLFAKGAAQCPGCQRLDLEEVERAA